jgi:hypothetical protein
VARDAEAHRISATFDPTPENVMRAVLTVNRAAKRRRDAAASSYEKGLHGFAGMHKIEKERCYRLKDIGIAWLASRGHLTAAYLNGHLVLWVGGDYSFHSTLLPRGAELPEMETEEVRIEAKPASAREMRIVDAVALLDKLNNVVGNYDRCQPKWMR